jgi:3-deoxy-D-manno-octulosonic-acid transferase
MFFIYTLLFSIGIVLTAPYYLWRLRGKVMRWADWRERLGLLPESYSQSATGAVWIHAVSVGETLAVVPLVKSIQETFPEVKIFLSHTTPAGRETGASRLPGVAGRFYMPLDWPWAARRVIERLRPSALLIVETEIWPNLLRAAHESGAHVALVNARISERSFRRYRLVPGFMRQVLGFVDWFGAQTRTDAERLLALGARPERVTVAGNLKFDGRPPELSRFAHTLAGAFRAMGREPVMIAASTMPQEEEKVLAAWKEIRKRFPQAILILAPRHPARFDAVAGTLDRFGRRFVRRTYRAPGAVELQSQLAQADVVLLDTVGELAGLFELADVVFVGGSLVPTGGHNLLEPAYWAKPILFGPHMENFPDAAEIFLKAQAAIQVKDEMELAKKTIELFADPKSREESGRRAKRALDEGTGATRRSMDQIRPWLETGKAARPERSRREQAAVRGSEAE